MKKIINIPVRVLTLIFVCFSLYIYIKLAGASGSGNEIEILYNLIGLLSFCLVLLIAIIALVLNTAKKIQEENDKNESINDVVISKSNDSNIAEKNALSESRRLDSIVNEFNGELIKENTPSFEEKSNAILRLIIKTIDADVGVFYKSEGNKMQIINSYACLFNEEDESVFNTNEGLLGEVARTLKPLNITDIPDGYVQVVTGLGKSSPSNILIFPLTIDGKLIGIVELAALRKFSDFDEKLLEQLCLLVAKEIEN